ncbi:MAG: hypothetical protein V1797_09840, partial [Pseudomonadota bacterium]
MRHRRTIRLIAWLLALCLAGPAAAAAAAPGPTQDSNNHGQPGRWKHRTDGEVGTVEIDRD